MSAPTDVRPVHGPAGPPLRAGRTPRGRVQRPPLPPGTGPLGRLAAFCFDHRGLIVVAWVLGLSLSVALSMIAGGDYEADYSARGSDSSAAQSLLEKRFPEQSGQVIDVVVHAQGGLDDPTAAAAVGRLFNQVGQEPHVLAVETPTEVGQISADTTTAVGHLRLDARLPADMPSAETHRLLDLADAADPTISVALSGEVVEGAEEASFSSETFGIAVAAIVLALALGSVVAAGLPLVVALLGVGISLSLIPVVAAVQPVPDWSTSLAAMIGIGIGIDYVLLLITRFREWRAEGLTPRAATVATLDTGGRAVVIAGTTVLISMTGLLAMGLSYMRGAALATILTVAVVVLAAITLLPAVLGYLGRHTERWSLRPARRSASDGGQGFWVRWARAVQQHRILAAVVGVMALVALALPLTTVRFGFPDAGNDRAETSTRQAYDLLTQGFGPGANAPLLVVASLPAATSSTTLDEVLAAVAGTPGVASVSPAGLNDAGDAAVISVVPTTGPQDQATDDLVRTLRDDVLPTATAGTPIRVHVGGVTAASLDSTSDTVRRLPLLIGGVVVMSLLLLLVAFRSIAIPLKAAVLNLLSVAAAYGVVAYVLQGGWAGQLIGVDTPTPLPAFIPVLMFAILFGLSMDYEVFLMSRMREAWAHTGDTATAVVSGLASTGRVITSAAIIMIAVFAAFVPSPDLFLKIIGIGLTTAIVVDVTLVRLLVLPAVMFLLGDRAWALPARWDARIPHLHIEGRPAIHRPPLQEQRPSHITSHIGS